MTCCSVGWDKCMTEASHSVVVWLERLDGFLHDPRMKCNDFERSQDWSFQYMQASICLQARSDCSRR